MLPPLPADLALLASWSAHTMRTDLTESRAQAQHICAEATATCASAAEIRLETAPLRHNAQQMRAIHAQPPGSRGTPTSRKVGRGKRQALLSQ